MEMKRSNTRFSAQHEIRQYGTLKYYLQSRKTALTLILKRKQKLYQDWELFSKILELN